MRNSWDKVDERQLGQGEVKKYGLKMIRETKVIWEDDKYFRHADLKEWWRLVCNNIVKNWCEKV